jgi:hypothetical protein
MGETRLLRLGSIYVDHYCILHFATGLGHGVRRHHNREGASHGEHEEKIHE